MSKISIACIAVSGTKILVAHRNPVGQMGGRWEFPGGKVEGDENEETAVVREMQEEFGMTVKVGELITEGSFCHNDETVLLHVYRIFVPHDGQSTPYTLTEHSGYQWIPVEDVPTLNFVDSDLSVYEQVKSYVLSGKGREE